MVPRPVSDRRRTNLSAIEKANRSGLRRRRADLAEALAYYGVLALMLFIFIIIGVLSWQAR